MSGLFVIGLVSERVLELGGGRDLGVSMSGVP